MTSIFISILVIVQFLFALLQPIGIVVLSLLIGQIPLDFDMHKSVATVDMGVGKMGIQTIRLFGLWCAILLVIGMNFTEAKKYFYLYKFHLIFVGIVVVSIIYAPSTMYGFRMVAKLSLPLMFMMLVLIVVRNQSQIKMLEKVVILGALISISLAILYSFKSSLQFFTVPGMSAAPFSAHLVVVGMLLLSMYIGEKNKIAGVIFICIVVAVIAAFTRITIAAMFISISVIMFLSTTGVKRFILPISSLFGLIALFLFNDKFRSRMFINSNDINTSSVINDPSAAIEGIHGSGRFEAWQTILEQFFLPSPLFGSGAGATQHLFYTKTANMSVIHSEYVRLLSEVGIIGLAFFVLVIGFYFIRIIQSYIQTKDISGVNYPLAACGALISYIIFFATDNGIDYVLQLGNFVFAFIALSEKGLELSKKSEVMDLPSLEGNNVKSRFIRKNSAKKYLLK